eukprot:1159056-Pelagomonas_calceolata.AAC.1
MERETRWLVRYRISAIPHFPKNPAEGVSKRIWSYEYKKLGVKDGSRVKLWAIFERSEARRGI